jgi:hypothetical protein
MLRRPTNLIPLEIIVNSLSAIAFDVNLLHLTSPIAADKKIDIHEKGGLPLFFYFLDLLKI